MTIKVQIVSKPSLKKGVRKTQLHKQYVQFKSWFSNNLYYCVKKSCSCDVEQWKRNPVKLHLIRADGFAIEVKSTIYLDGTSDSCLHDLLSVTPFDHQCSNLNNVISSITNRDTGKVRTITVVFQTANELTYVLTNRSSFIISSSGTVIKNTNEATNPTLIDKTSKIAPEYLLEGTTVRRVTNPTGCRFWLIYLHNMIEELCQNYQDYCNKMENNVPVHSQVQVSSYKVFKFSRVCGYKLSDGTSGFSFKDKTCLVLSSDSEQMYYINYLGQISYFKDVVSASRCLVGKPFYLCLFKNFTSTDTYWDKEVTTRTLHDMPFLVKWFIGSDYMVMYFSNGTLEISFRTGHKTERKIIFSPFMRPISISEGGQNGSVSSIDMKFASYVSKRLFQRWSLSHSRLPHDISKFLEENNADG